MVRNEIVFDSFKISGIDATNLLYYEGAGVVAEKTQISLDEVQERERIRESQKIGSAPSPRMINDYQSERGFQLLRDNYMWIPVLHAKGMVKVLFGPGISDIKNLFVSIPLLIKPLQDFSLCLNIFAIFFAMIGLFSSIVPRRVKYTLIVVSIVLLFVSSGASANSRFRAPLVPVIALFASTGLEKSLRKFHKFSPRIS
jgi:hypothetical protein